MGRSSAVPQDRIEISGGTPVISAYKAWQAPAVGPGVQRLPLRGKRGDLAMLVHVFGQVMPDQVVTVFTVGVRIQPASVMRCKVVIDIVCGLAYLAVALRPGIDCAERPTISWRPGATVDQFVIVVP